MLGLPSPKERTLAVSEQSLEWVADPFQDITAVDEFAEVLGHLKYGRWDHLMVARSIVFSGSWTVLMSTGHYVLFTIGPPPLATTVDVYLITDKPIT